MNATQQAWTAFLLSSALIIGTLLPVINYGYIFLRYPVFIFFGCDGARNGRDCLRIQLTPFFPIALTIIALIGCRIAIRRAWYVTSAVISASACAVSWLLILRGFR